MKRFFSIFLTLAVAVAAVGCYNDFDTPDPLDAVRPATDADFDPAQYRTIKQVKQLFLDRFGSVSNTGDTLASNGWNGSGPSTCYVKIEDDIYIKGKVMSSDEEGNIYKSLYLCDDSGAIEIKLGTGLYISYPMGELDTATGEIPTHYVYVKLKGLYLGNYRMMLSIGDGPTDSYNKVNEHRFYANSNIENKTRVAEHVFLGQATELKVGREILEIDASNYNTIYGEANQDNLGRLVLLRGVTCHYFDEGSNASDSKYPGWMDRYLKDGSAETVFKHWYRWAFNDKTYPTSASLYGSVVFSFSTAKPSSVNSAGIYVVRTSGYSRFASQPITREGAKGDILGILSIYAKRWNYYETYQLAVNRFQDLMFGSSDFLTEEEVKMMTPNGWTDNLVGVGSYSQDDDSYYTPSTEDPNGDRTNND